MKIGVIASINIDVFYRLDRFLSVGETTNVDEYKILLGGKGCNQAVMLEALGTSPVAFGALGDDPMEQMARQMLEEKGLSTTSILRKPGSTGLALIQLINDDNAITVIPGNNKNITKTEVDAFLRENELTHLVLCFETNMDAVVYIIEQAKIRDIKVIINPAPMREFPMSMLDSIEYFIPNEIEAKQLFGDNLEAAVEQMQGKLVVTMGAQGVMYYEAGVKQHPAESIKVVDTVGAGDSFVAGFSAGIYRGYSLTKAIELGTKTAALTCQYLGAQGAFEKVKQTLQHD
jgi:ribokinase